MRDSIKWVANRMPKSDDRQLSIMSLGNVAKARFFHSSFPQYSITPLARLDGMAKYLGLGDLFVKDESFRFGLNAFKVLGGSFAMARYIAKEMGRDVSEMTYDYLTSEAFRQEFGHATFFTATDGNHGRGVAWAAHKLGQKAVVHMPKGSSQARYENIAKEGAQVTIEEVNYDDCVRMAAAEAAETKHGVVVQDTAWEGYEEIPAWIMQGYGTMANEAAEQLRQVGINRPTHVFVQAGVGSLAGAVIGYFTNLFPNDPPTFVVMEARAADCLYQGALAGDGQPRIVEGDLKTIMAGLACGEGSRDVLPEPDRLDADALRTEALDHRADLVVDLHETLGQRAGRRRGHAPVGHARQMRPALLDDPPARMGEPGIDPHHDARLASQKISPTFQIRVGLILEHMFVKSKQNYGRWPMPPSNVRVSPLMNLKSGLASCTTTRPISVSTLP